MTTRIYNARILTMAEDNCTPFMGEVHIDGDTITYVGQQVDENKVWDKEIDAKGNLIMPGFKNAHTHSAMTFLRSYADDMELQDWLFNNIFPAEGKLTEEGVYWFTKLAVMEYLTSGITSAYDMYFHINEGVRAATEAGFRYVICDSINDFGGSVEQMEEDFNRFNNDGNPLSSFRLGFHAEYTTKKETIEELAELAHKLKQSVSTHCSETISEVEGCEERYGMSPIAFFESLGLLDYGGSLFHGVHLREGDYEILKKRNMVVVTNPSSNLKLASGIAPVKRLLDEGITVAIGTDGPASNNCLDMFREMFLVSGLQKVTCKDPKAVPAHEVLKMATVNGAVAMGLEDCKYLAKGQKADIIMLDLKQPNMQPLRSICKNIVYSGSKQNVKMTMIGGKVLYYNNEFMLDVDAQQIYDKSNELIEKLLGEKMQ